MNVYKVLDFILSSIFSGFYEVNFMSNKKYSKEICNKLFEIARNPILKITPRRTHYDAGDNLTLQIKGVIPGAQGQAILAVEKFIGSGFAGQVYRCRLKSLQLSNGSHIEDLEEGKLYSVKINVPHSSFSTHFRNLIYWLAFQGSFRAQNNESACHSGLLFQKLMRRAAKKIFGSEKAVKDVFAYFYDSNLNAYGEISEWVVGRMWKLESDQKLRGRKKWKSVSLAEVGSPEYIAKRRFMANIVTLAHEMGAAEFARQYEWWTMKSQSNSLYRLDFSYTNEPGQNLCAIDFRTGLALLPFLPMSPVDIKLIFQGFMRGNLVQFDRNNIKKARVFFENNSDLFSDMQPAIQEFFKQDRAYRRSLPDITHHGFHLIFDSQLRKDVRIGLAESYYFSGLIDESFLEKLKAEKFCGIFPFFYLLGVLPFLGKKVRKFWGNVNYRKHIFNRLTNFTYFKASLNSSTANTLANWHQSGRVDEKHVNFLLKLPLLFIFEKFTLGFFPVIIHNFILRPSILWHFFFDWFLFLKHFIFNSNFREQWLLTEIELGREDGIVSQKEAAQLKVITKDPYVARYLKYLGVHFFSAIFTRIVSFSTGFFWAFWLLAQGNSWGEAIAAFGLTILFFQVFPISPGSIFRGLFVIYLIIRDRNIRGYLIAAPVSFIKTIGYLAFPLQMATTYPQLAKFMASRWTIMATRFIPVFGERGTLLEHLVFDAFFNYPQKFFIWAKLYLTQDKKS